MGFNRRFDSSMKNTTILITGGAGYIGSHLAVRLLKEGARVIVFDIQKPHKDIFKATPCVFGDVRDAQNMTMVLKQWRPDGVVHLAALTRVSASDTHKREQTRTNVVGTQNLLEAMITSQCHSLVFSSSAAVYGECSIPTQETQRRTPISIYGETKKEAENIILRYQTINTATLRLFNVVGFGDAVPLTKKNEERNSLHTNIARTFLGKLKTLTVYGSNLPTKDGTTVRDYVHVEDATEAMRVSLKSVWQKKRSLVVNIGSGTATTTLEVIRMMECLAKRRTTVRFHRVRSNEIVMSVADIQRAKHALGWTPSMSSVSAIARSVCRYYGLT